MSAESILVVARTNANTAYEYAMRTAKFPNKPVIMADPALLSDIACQPEYAVTLGNDGVKQRFYRGIEVQLKPSPSQTLIQQLAESPVFREMVRDLMRELSNIVPPYNPDQPQLWDIPPEQPKGDELP